MAVSRPPLFSGMVGQSPPMQALFRQIQLVAPKDVAVLILGERGTGKELVADAIQTLSPRRGKPYKKLNCAGLPKELLASELFGHDLGLPPRSPYLAPGPALQPGAPSGPSASGFSLNPRQQEALRLAATRGSVRPRDLIVCFGISGEAIRRDLKALVEAGLLSREGACKASRYFLP